MAEGRGIAAGAVQALLCLALTQMQAHSLLLKCAGVTLGVFARRLLMLCRSEPFLPFQKA